MLKRIRKYRQRRKVIGAVGSFDETGLLIAIEEMRRDLIAILIEAGISVDCKDERGIPALIKAVKSNDLPMVKMLIDAKADIDIKDREGKTAIMKAIEEGNKHVFSFLLDQDPDLELTNNQGDSVLIKAAQEGSTTTCRKLIEANVDVDAANKKGITPLMVAVDHHRTGIIKSLLHAGADPNIRDFQGHSVLDRHHASPRITRMLKEASVRHQIKNGSYSPPPKEDNSNGLFGQVQGISSLLLTLTADALNILEKSDQLEELENRGKLLLSQINPESLINNTADREKIANWMYTQLNWGLSVLVDLKNINEQLKAISENGDSTKSMKSIQNRISYLISAFSQFLMEKNEEYLEEEEVTFSPIQENLEDQAPSSTNTPEENE